MSVTFTWFGLQDIGFIWKTTCKRYFRKQFLMYFLAIYFPYVFCGTEAFDLLQKLFSRECSDYIFMEVAIGTPSEILFFFSSATDHQVKVLINAIFLDFFLACHIFIFIWRFIFIVVGLQDLYERKYSSEINVQPDRKSQRHGDCRQISLLILGEFKQIN